MYEVEQIKQQLDFTDILQKYGFEVNRAGFISCPFHTTDKTPSLKISKSNKSFKCYGCNAGGTVIDFVMNLFNIKFNEAIVKIDNDFCLGLTRKLTLREAQAIKVKQIEMIKKRQQEQRDQEEKKQNYYEALDLWILNEHIKNKYEPKDPYEEWNPNFKQALHNYSEIKFYIESR